MDTTHLLAITALIPSAVTVVLQFISNLRWAGRLVAFAAWLQLVLLASLTTPLFNQSMDSIYVSPDFFLNKIDAAFLLLTATVAACALTHAHVFFQRELEAKPAPAPSHIRLNYICTLFFVLAMLICYFCKNLGYLWICVESTTLLSAPLVYFCRTKHALEATWKYLIICSVGISFALLGTLFIFASSQHGAIHGGTLCNKDLIAAAPLLDYKLLRIGFIFCLLGYGTKAGMFPLHSWLPDAHSEAPAPSSALLSGALLNCSLYAIWSICQILNASIHPQSGRELTLWAGTATVCAASFFLIRQYAMKRLLAYSSIENVGVMLFAIGINSGPLFFFQALNHSISKVSLFLLAGNLVQATGKKHLPRQSGLIASAPAWAVLLILSTFAATGAPPFGTFLSEFLILIKAIQSHYYINAGLLLIGLSLSFIVVCMHVGKVVLGGPHPKIEYFRPLVSSLIPALLMLASLLFGLTSGSAILSHL